MARAEKVVTYQDTKDERIKMLGETYHARFSLKGQRIQKSLQTKNFRVAIQLVDDLQRAILLGEDWRKEKELFEALWPEFLEAKAQGKQRGKKIRKVREKTLKEYIAFGERWYLEFFKDTRVDKIDGEKWEAYLAYVRENSRSGAQTKILNHWKYLSGFMSWCLAMGHIKKMPDIYNPDEADEDGIGINFSDEQLKAFRDGATGASRLWILMAQYMGMRSSEITQLAKDRIDASAQLIRLRRIDTKTNQGRVIPIHPAVRPELEKQMSAFGDSPFLFPNAWDQKRPMDRTGFKKPWTNLRQSLGIEGRFHDFRHSYATRAFSHPDLNPVVVCKALGMSMNVALKVYIHLDESHLKRLSTAFQLGEGIGK